MIAQGTLEQLLAYGFHLFPVNTEGRPLKTAHGCKDAVNDSETLIPMFEERRHDNPQVAIACEPSGLFVLDVDIKKGKKGFETLAALTAQYGKLPDTVTVHTPSGGQHFYFRGVGRSTVGTLGNGLDTRGTGGYVVCPPSERADGTTYAWGTGRSPEDIPIADAPSWLIALSDHKAATPQRSPSKELLQGDQTQEDDRIPEGERNTTLFKHACALRGQGSNIEDILRALLARNEAQCQPPLSTDDVRKIAHSVEKYPPGHPPHDPDASGLESFTDTGNAKMLVRLFGTCLRYTAQRGWLVWDGTRWRMDEDGAVDRYAKQVPEHITQEAHHIGDKDLRNAALRHATQSLNQARLEAMKKNASTELAVRRRYEEFDADPLLFNVRNGTVDLRTGHLHPHDPAQHLTKLTPVTFHGNATCPQWRAFLTDIMCEDAEMVHFLQRVVGYTLTGLTSEQCLFVLYGTGANGKSAFLNVLKHLLGEYGRTAEFRTFLERKNDTIRNDLARLAGARFVAGSEGDAGSALSESVVKALTGGDTIAARFLHKEHFEFVPQFKLFLATNHKPYIANQDEGIWRRIRLIPFEKSIPKDAQNPDLVRDVLLPELPGILQWALQGCLDWQDKGGLQPPARVLDATEEYREEMDNLGPFIEACFSVSKEYQSPSGEIYQIYIEWCRANNIRKPLVQNTLIAKLVERGFAKHRTSKERGLKGLKVNPLWRDTTGFTPQDLHLLRHRN